MDRWQSQWLGRWGEELAFLPSPQDVPGEAQVSHGTLTCLTHHAGRPMLVHSAPRRASHWPPVASALHAQLA